MTDTSQEILERARQRGEQKGLAYFGEVTPAEAWELAKRGDARIVDVRTAAEWQYVGHIPQSQLIEWRSFGADKPNPNFASELAAQVPKSDVVLLLCRSAQRSHAAAAVAAAAGYSRVLNILEGFEGDLDTDGQRGRVSGWRKAGLPWVQS